MKETRCSSGLEMVPYPALQRSDSPESGGSQHGTCPIANSTMTTLKMLLTVFWTGMHKMSVLTWQIQLSDMGYWLGAHFTRWFDLLYGHSIQTISSPNLSHFITGSAFTTVTLWEIAFRILRLVRRFKAKACSTLILAKPMLCYIIFWSYYYTGKINKWMNGCRIYFETTFTNHKEMASNIKIFQCIKTFWVCVKEHIQQKSLKNLL